jgi:hypothetical protein
VAWELNERSRPTSAAGRLRYPIAYPANHAAAFSGHGFHISAPFVSDTGRHGTSGADRNECLLRQGRDAFASVLARDLLAPHGPAIYHLLRSRARPDPDAEQYITGRLVAEGALLTEGRHLGGRKRLSGAPNRNQPITIASFSWRTERPEPVLARIVPPGTRLIDRRTPEFFH